MNFKGRKVLMLVMVSLLFFTNRALAGDISFEEALEGALDTNRDIIRAREEVERVKRGYSKGRG